MSQSLHWSFFWLIYFFIWTIFREFFKPKWYDTDTDLLIITWCSAIIPFYVENAMKFQQNIQLQKQEEQLKMLENQTKLLIEMAQLSISIGKDTLKSLDEISDELDEDNDKAQRED